MPVLGGVGAGVVVERNRVSGVGFLTLVLSPVLRASRMRWFCRRLFTLRTWFLLSRLRALLWAFLQESLPEFLVGATDEPLATFDTGSVHTESYLLFSGSDLEMGMRKRYSTSNLRKNTSADVWVQLGAVVAKAESRKPPGQFLALGIHLKIVAGIAHLGAQQDGVIEGGHL